MVMGHSHSKVILFAPAAAPVSTMTQTTMTGILFLFCFCLFFLLMKILSFIGSSLPNHHHLVPTMTQTTLFVVWVRYFVSFLFLFFTNVIFCRFLPRRPTT